MEREDIAKMGERELVRLRSTDLRPEEVRRFVVRTTSGTSGGQPIVIVGRNRPGLFSIFKNSARLIVCMGAMSARLTNVLAVRYVDGNAPMRVIAADGKDLTPETGPLLDDFAPDMLHGTPSFIAGLVQTLSSAARLGLRDMQLTGEFLTEQLAHSLAEQAPNAAVHMAYVTSELGPLSQADCTYLGRNRYHPRDGVLIEIESPDESGAGEVYASTMIGKDRVDHYRVGDVARFLPPCRCGAPVAFELIGRTGRDYVKLVGAILRREEFDRVMRLFPYIDDYRVEAREVGAAGTPKGHLTLKLYRRGGPITDALAEEMAQRFARELLLTPTRTLADLVKQGIFLPLEVEFPAEPPRQGHKDIKIIQVQS